MAFKLIWHPENNRINKDKYAKLIPNFNKLDITIDRYNILGNTLSQKSLHWHQKYLRFRGKP
jgi:hypothetical protein